MINEALEVSEDELQPKKKRPIEKLVDKIDGVSSQNDNLMSQDDYEALKSDVLRLLRRRYQKK